MTICPDNQGRLRGRASRRYRLHWRSYLAVFTCLCSHRNTHCCCGSVVIKSCEERWSTTQRIQPKGSCDGFSTSHEFQAATELAEDYDARLILADETYEKITSISTQCWCRRSKTCLDRPKDGTQFFPKKGWRENIDPQLPINSKTESRGIKIFLGRNNLFHVGMLQSAPDILRLQETKISRFAKGRLGYIHVLRLQEARSNIW